MGQNSSSSKGAIYRLIAIILIVLAVFLVFGLDRVFWGTMCVVAAIVLFHSGNTKESQAVIAGQTEVYLRSHPEVKQLVDEVREAADIDKILNNKNFYDRGVKLVSIDPKNTVNLVLTRNCLYDGIFQGYRQPLGGVADVSFVRGQEFQATTRVQMDEGRMAAAGLMAGGLGVAAMNAASAREANAQGGAVVGYRSGNYRFMLSVRKDTDHVWVLLLRNEDLKALGNPFPNCRNREGKYYTVFYCQLLPGAVCSQSAQQVSAFLKKLVQRN
ncbi:MAG: hypothetical protein IJC68_01865 [Firmicutes bacterium]|nr:hypothetical protein [Bacillota bacterium]